MSPVDVFVRFACDTPIEVFIKRLVVRVSLSKLLESGVSVDCSSEGSVPDGKPEVVAWK